MKRKENNILLLLFLALSLSFLNEEPVFFMRSSVGVFGRTLLHFAEIFGQQDVESPWGLPLRVSHTPVTVQNSNAPPMCPKGADRPATGPGAGRVGTPPIQGSMCHSIPQ